MRYKLIIVLIVSVLFGCKSNFDDKAKRNENWAWWTDAKTGKSSWIPFKGKGVSVKNGRYTRFYFNGNIYEKGRLVDGKEADTIFCYDLGGRLQEYIILKNDSDKYYGREDSIDYFIHNGSIKMYFANGKLASNGIVKNHDYGNNWIGYFESGKPCFVKNLKSDTGWSIRYYENGKIKDSIYNEGGNAFHIKHWYENGHLAESTEFKSGNFNGVEKEYFDNGQLKVIGNVVNGKLDGKVTQWYEDGKLRGRGNKKNGKWDGIQILFYENGQEQLEMTAKNGIANGEVKKYNEAGKLISDDIFKDGVKVQNKLLFPVVH